MIKYFDLSSFFESCEKEGCKTEEDIYNKIVNNEQLIELIQQSDKLELEVYKKNNK